MFFATAIAVIPRNTVAATMVVTNSATIELAAKRPSRELLGDGAECLPISGAP